MLKHLQLKPLIPLFLIFLFMIAAYLLISFHPSPWEKLRQLYLYLKNFNENHPIATPLLFISIYVLYALLSLPGIFFLSLLAGFLFRQPFSTIYVTIAATFGASLLFLVFRSAFGEFFYKRSSHLLKNLEKGFQENAVSYLLFLRLIPLFPFWIGNLAGAFFNVSFWVFAWTTFVGMIPSVFIYTEAGRSFNLLLQHADPLTPAKFFNWHMIIALMSLALLSLLPILFNHWRKHS